MITAAELERRLSWQAPVAPVPAGENGVMLWVCRNARVRSPADLSQPAKLPVRTSQAGGGLQRMGRGGGTAAPLDSGEKHDHRLLILSCGRPGSSVSYWSVCLLHMRYDLKTGEAMRMADLTMLTECSRVVSQRFVLRDIPTGPLPSIAPCAAHRCGEVCCARRSRWQDSTQHHKHEYCTAHADGKKPRYISSARFSSYLDTRITMTQTVIGFGEKGSAVLSGIWRPEYRESRD